MALAVFLLGGCDCSPPPVTGCASNAGCSSDEFCQDGVCVSRPDAAGMDAGSPDDDAGDMCPSAQVCSNASVCCPDGEECVDGFLCLPVCENSRCGDNGMICCEAAEVCLDGVVCAAQCAPAETLCGADNDTCCGSGDVCLDDACVTPGVECADDFDCRDAALYCEPTLGRCLPTPSGVACEVVPDFDEISLVEEWHWTGTDLNGSTWENVLYSPMVGDVSGDGIPDVIIPAYVTGSSWHDPIIVGLSGDDGTLLFTIDRDPAYYGEGEGIALANFDPSDDALEFVYRMDAGGLRMMDGDGVTELAIRAGPNVRGSVEVADFNHDGIPDVVVGCRVYDGTDISNPALDIIDAGSCPNDGVFEGPVIADLDGDGELELCNGQVAYNHDGSVLWSGGPAMQVAVADMDADGSAEVIAVGAGEVRVLDGATGATLIGPGGTWVDGTFTIPGGGEGGPPTVADFDGDGLPEIATAGRRAYAVYDPDCFDPPARSGGDACATTNFLRWETLTQDESSSVTGSSVFDFQGDGVAEVVYNDECFLHIYDGRDGTELLMEPIPNSSRTGYEYPIVVDVDGDGNSEIVVVANNDQAVSRDNCPEAYRLAFGLDPGDPLPAAYATGTSGVFVYGDAFDRWVPTRPIWNQYSYHVTNVGSSGEVPATEMDNWTTPGLNNYRQNVQGGAILNAPNLEVSLSAAAMCASRSVSLSALVRNVGSRGVPAGIDVVFVRTDISPEEVLATSATTGSLLPGGNERVSVVASALPVDTDLTFEVRVDGASAAVECNEDDNVGSASNRCPGLE